MGKKRKKVLAREQHVNTRTHWRRRYGSTGRWNGWHGEMVSGSEDGAELLSRIGKFHPGPLQACVSLAGPHLSSVLQLPALQGTLGSLPCGKRCSSATLSVLNGARAYMAGGGQALAGTPVSYQQGSMGLPFPSRHWAKHAADNIWLQAGRRIRPRLRPLVTTATSTTASTTTWKQVKAASGLRLRGPIDELIEPPSRGPMRPGGRQH